MSIGLGTGGLALAVLAVGVAAFMAGAARARGLAGEKLSSLHSRPGYHGALTALFATLPALLLVVAWAFTEPVLLERGVTANFPADMQQAPVAVQSLTRAQIRSLAAGFRQLSDGELAAIKSGSKTVEELFGAKGISIGSEPQPFMIEAADQLNTGADQSRFYATLSALLLAALGTGFGLSRITPATRARNTVEQAALYGLIAASTVAVLTTAGIVLSMLFQSLRGLERR